MPIRAPPPDAARQLDSRVWSGSPDATSRVWEPLPPSGGKDLSDPRKCETPNEHHGYVDSQAGGTQWDRNFFVVYPPQPAVAYHRRSSFASSLMLSLSLRIYSSSDMTMIPRASENLARTKSAGLLDIVHHQVSVGGIRSENVDNQTRVIPLVVRHGQLQQPVAFGDAEPDVGDLVQERSGFVQSLKIRLARRQSVRRRWGTARPVGLAAA